MAYSDKVVDHYEHPRNVGTLPKDDPNVGTGLVGAPECGDVMRLQMKINPETQIIDRMGQGQDGCGSARHLEHGHRARVEPPAREDSLLGPRRGRHQGRHRGLEEKERNFHSRRDRDISRRLEAAPIWVLWVDFVGSLCGSRLQPRRSGQ